MDQTVRWVIVAVALLLWPLGLDSAQPLFSPTQDEFFWPDSSVNE